MVDRDAFQVYENVLIGSKFLSTVSVLFFFFFYINDYTKQSCRSLQNSGVVDSLLGTLLYDETEIKSKFNHPTLRTKSNK